MPTSASGHARIGTLRGRPAGCNARTTTVASAATAVTETAQGPQLVEAAGYVPATVEQHKGAENQLSAREEKREHGDGCKVHTVQFEVDARKRDPLSGDQPHHEIGEDRGEAATERPLAHLADAVGWGVTIPSLLLS